MQPAGGHHRGGRQPRVTSHDVARVAGVSQATVSRVLAGSPQVREQTRDRVLAALQQTGYVPHAPARAMKTQRTGTVGVVVARITNPFYPQLLQELGRQLAAAGMRMIVWDEEGPGEEGAVDAIRQGLIDGVVFTTALPDSAALRAALRRRAPLVLLNRGVDDLECDQVTCDNRAGGRIAAGYLVAGARRRIAFLGGPGTASTARDRERGFLEGLQAHGIVLPPARLQAGDFTYEQARKLGAGLLAAPDPVDAVFCVNDLTAFGMLDAARVAGVRVPEDLWVVGFDDIDMAAWPTFDLTTLRQDVAAMAAQAVRLLGRRVNGSGGRASRHRFSPALIVRGSTAHHPWKGA